MIRIAVIGTSDRSVPDNHSFTKKLFGRMVDAVDAHIRSQFDHFDLEKVILVSGGSAWADHVAVYLYLNKGYPKLELYFFCDFTSDGFVDSGVVDWRTNPGGTLNYYFKRFNTIRRVDAFEELVTAREQGARCNDDHKSFHSRNSVVAKSDHMIALTWGESSPEDGGTLDTWKKCKGEKHHISLGKL